MTIQSIKLIKWDQMKGDEMKWDENEKINVRYVPRKKQYTDIYTKQ